MKNIYYALAYYLIGPISNPEEEVALHKSFFTDRDVSCRVYISEDGINGQLSAHIADAEAYMNWLRSRPDFANIRFKIHEINSNIFPRITVKYRKSLLGLDCPVDWSLRGEHISPEDWKNKLLEGKSLVLDVRNNYEWKIGHFENAVLPDLKTFREFPDYAEKLAQERGIDIPVMMYCTGGIRCEFYSAIMMEKGFKTIYQLDGGVIAYGLTVGQDLWKGKLFVFDDRLAVPISSGVDAIPITECQDCGCPSDVYYNCANVKCNRLFISCQECVNKHGCCCSEDCIVSSTVRLYDSSLGNRPFRRKSCQVCGKE